VFLRGDSCFNAPRFKKDSCAQSFNPLEKIIHRHAKTSVRNVTASHFLAKRALIRTSDSFLCAPRKRKAGAISARNEVLTNQNA